MVDYKKFENKKKKKEMMKLSDLTDEQRATMKVKHYNLHIPANAHPDQINFIQRVAKAVLNNEPITVVHEDAMRFLLRLAYNYRNILTEFDEQDRWSNDDDRDLNKVSRQFQPIIDYLQEEFKLDVSKFRRD